MPVFADNIDGLVFVLLWIIAAGLVGLLGVSVAIGMVIVRVLRTPSLIWVWFGAIFGFLCTALGALPLAILLRGGAGIWEWPNLLIVVGIADLALAGDMWRQLAVRRARL